jgi:dihydroorotase
MVGLESALSVVQAALVDTGHVTWEGVARLLSTTPARIGQVEGYAHPLTKGSAANITLVDPSFTAAWDVDRLVGGSRNTPFGGLQLPGRVMATIFRGTETVIDGRIVSELRTA